MISQSLTTNTWYDIRIQETCIDPNAESPIFVKNRAVRTRPVQATKPSLLSAVAASSRSILVTWIPGQPNECVFAGWRLEWKYEGPRPGAGVWTYSTGCGPRDIPRCITSGFPYSDSNYRVRLVELCTDELAQPDWVEWHDLIKTWPEPAQPPNLTMVDLRAYRLTFTFEPGLPLDCIFQRWKVEMGPGDVPDEFDPYKALLPTDPKWYEVEECIPQLNSRTNTTCTITGLSSFTRYRLRVKEVCTSYVYDSNWGYMPDFNTTMPIPAGPPRNLSHVPDSITAFFFDVSWIAA